MYRVAQIVVPFSTHHNFGIVQDKMKRISPKCSQGFWEQRLGCNFYVAVYKLAQCYYTVVLIEVFFSCHNCAKYEANFVILFSVIIRNDLCIKSVIVFPTTFQLCCHLTLDTFDIFPI